MAFDKIRLQMFEETITDTVQAEWALRKVQTLANDWIAIHEKKIGFCVIDVKYYASDTRFSVCIVYKDGITVEE